MQCRTDLWPRGEFCLSLAISENKVHETLGRTLLIIHHQLSPEPLPDYWRERERETVVLCSLQEYLVWQFKEEEGSQVCVPGLEKHLTYMTRGYLIPKAECAGAPPPHTHTGPVPRIP